MTNSNILVNQ